MKCKFAVGLLSLVAAHLGLAQTSLFYENNGIVKVPEYGVAPNIDAINFINNNYFDIQGIETGGRPYYTAHTINYTNNGTMISDVGFLFETFDPGALQADQFRWASSFENIGTVACGVTSNALGNVFLPGFSKLLISASNVYSPGMLLAGPDSFVSMNGSDVDINRGVVLMEGFTDLSPSNNTLGLFDGYWNLAVSEGPPADPAYGPYINSGIPSTPPFPVTNRLGMITNAQIILTNGVFYYSESFDITGSNRLVRAVFIQNTNVLVEPKVFLIDDSPYFDPFYDPIIIEWSWTNSPLFDPVQQPDFLYLVDDLSEPRRDVGLFPSGIAANRITYTPGNYSFLRGGPRLAGVVPSVPSPRVILPGGLTNTWAAYQALFQPTSVLPSDTPGQNATNMPGRIILTATNSLAMNMSYIVGPNTMEISSPNSFLGNEKAQIAVPLASLDFRNTNGFMAITNLMHPAIPRPEGTISCWSARFTNVTANITNHFHVLFVDSRFQPNSPGRIQDLKLSVTNLLVNDPLNIMRYVTLETERLTIASNAPTARTATGAINLLSPTTVWSTATPTLRYLTNYGTISTLNAVYFGGSRSQPYYNNNFNEPYDAFVNYGTVVDEGSLVWSRYFENLGSFRSSSGSFTLTSIEARMPGSRLDTPGGDIFLTGSNLYLSNTVFSAGRRLSLTVTNYLDDGGFTNGSVWVVGSGNSSVPGISLRLPRKPVAANLLGTTITNIAPPNADSRVVWDGQDLGPTAAGYANNGAIGRLILDARNDNSVFTFAPAGVSGAIYVDYLELRNFATNYGGSSNFTAIAIAPNMKVYYAQAVDGEGRPLAARLNGLNNGRLVWASSYAGYFSSTNMVYPDGSTNRVNYALVTSCGLDSDGDGIPNCADSDPVPPTGPGGGTEYPPPPPGGWTNDPGTEPDIVQDPATLAYPGALAPMDEVVRTVGQVAGRYTGLFFEPDAVKAESSGSVTLTTTARGAYSGKLVLGGKAYAIAGKFNPDGTAQRTINRRGLPPVAVSVQLDLSVNGSQVQGTVSSGSWSSDLVANRGTYHKTAKPCQFAGTYSFIVPPNADCAGSPGGFSFGSVRIDAGGAVVWTGTLADGTKLSQGSAVSRDGLWPLYSGAYAGRGLALSWVELSPSDFGGGLVWIKPVCKAKYYPGGFTNLTSVVGSRLAKVPSTALIPLRQGFGQLSFNGDFLSAPFDATVYLGANNRFHSSHPRLSLGISPRTGWFWGSVPNPDTGKLLSFQGMLVQEGNYGAGFAWSANCTGSVLLTPAP